jgi:hypothetical protein
MIQGRDCADVERVVDGGDGGGGGGGGKGWWMRGMAEAWVEMGKMVDGRDGRGGGGGGKGWYILMQLHPDLHADISPAGTLQSSVKNPRPC